MNRKTFRIAWMSAILITTTLACRLVSGIGETKATIEAAATDAKAGITILGTAKAVLTDVGGSGILQTAQAAATEIGDSGMMDTAVAALTEQGPGLMETAKAFATNEAPGLQETIQASMGEPPDDIPMMSGDLSDLFSNSQMVSYSVAASFDEVVTYYKSEMPKEGWAPSDNDPVETEDVVVLYYEKEGRAATVTIQVNPIDRKTIVAVLISGQ